MKTLIVHPQDQSTRFLTGIYKNLPNKTVITGGIAKPELRKYIRDFDRVICCGHGSPAGLFSVGWFPGAYPYVVDESMVESIRNKDCIFIWCYADQFVNRHQLSGFFTSMFLSEVSEALYFNFWNLNDLEHLIEESNYGFAEIVSKYINEPVDVLYQNVLLEYGMLAKTNPIASFNFKRLFLAQPEPALYSNQVGNIL